MKVYVALLRGINVGGSGRLAMRDLTAICDGLGFLNPQTYIQSGNVVFQCTLPESVVRSKLEQALEPRMGKNIDVIIRTAAEMRSALDANPFPTMDPAKIAVVFLSEALTTAPAPDFVGPGGEQGRVGKREIYVYYPEGMGRSKLKLSLAGAPATIRNIRTVAKLVELANGSRNAEGFYPG